MRDDVPMMWNNDFDPDDYICPDCEYAFDAHGDCGCTINIPPPSSRDITHAVAKAMLRFTTLCTEVHLLEKRGRE